MQLNTIQPGTIIATVLGLVIAAIVYLTVAGTPIPLIGGGRAALVSVVVLAFAMCVTSGWGSTGTIPTGPLSIAAAVAGILTLVVLGAVMFGWTWVIDPLGGVLYGSGSAADADRIGIIWVGILVAISWLAATIRQLGVFTAVTTG
jgi:hypothetical protein